MGTPTDDQTVLQAAMAQGRSRVAPVSDSPQQATKTPQPGVSEPDTRTAEQKTADAERREAETQESAQNYQRQQRIEQWEAIGAEIGPDYAAASLKDWTFHGSERQQQYQQDVLTGVRGYLNDFQANVTAGRNLIFLGPVGSGKDFLMASAMRHAVLCWGRRVEWRNGSPMYAEFRRAMNPNWDRSEFGLLTELVDCQILAISDPLPPSGSLSEFQASTLFSILDGRYRARRPTFLTLNVLNRDEACTRMGSQNVDRIAHRAVTLFCNWGSYREFERQEASK